MRGECQNCGYRELEYLYSAPGFDNLDSRAGQTFDLARCLRCQLVNTSLEQTGHAPDTAAAYTAGYYGSSSSKFVAVIERALAFATARRARKILRLWRQQGGTGQPPSVLDIGCGRGLLLRAFQAEGANVVGLERGEFPIGADCSDIVRPGSLSDEAYADARFDIVILWHVLEHLVEHETLLDDIASHLNRDGMLVLAVPDFGSWQQRLFSRHWFHLDLPRHLVHFDTRWLLRKLLDRGYTIERQSHLDLIQNTYGFIQSSLNSLAPRHQNAYYDMLKHGTQFSKLLRLPFLGWSLLTIALLPLALLECTVGAILGTGATVQIFARLRKNDD